MVNGFLAYQVKKYVSAPTSRQVKNIEDSWIRVNSSFGSTSKITAWFLTMPWDPTEHREKWLADDLAKDGHLPGQVAGRAPLLRDVFRHRSLVELFFEDGIDKINKLLASLTAMAPRGHALDYGPDNIAAIIQGHPIEWPSAVGVIGEILCVEPPCVF